MKTLLRYLCLITIVGAVLVVTAWLTFSEYNRLPSDASVVKRFAEKKPLLIELKTKLSQEPANVIGITQTNVMIDNTNNRVLPKEAQMTEEHFLQYQIVMRKASIKEVWRSDGAIHFYFAGAGFASFGWRLLFVYMQGTPSPITSSIDAPSEPDDSTTGRTIRYRPLGENWYIGLIN